MNSENRIGIVGPGLMGLGLCHTIAASGVQAILVGRNGEAARRGLERLASDLQARVKRGRMTFEAANAIVANISAADDDRALHDCGLVVEAVAEERALKSDVLRRIEAVVSADTIISSTTSGLPITGLAAALQNAGRFIGLHFFSPVDRMALVEVVTGEATSPPTLESALQWVRRVGKQPIVVRDSPGFFTSRIFSAYLDEAAVMVAEGIAPSLIEDAAHEAGLKIGPLAMLDETGIALNHQQALQARADGLADRFCRLLAYPVLDQMVSLGRRGRRDGGGFYQYGADGSKALWSGLAELYPPKPTQPPLDTVRQRLMHAQALEAARCLEEGVVTTARDADTGSVLGLGFPAAEGGVLGQIERRGLNRFVAECDTLAQHHGARFCPSDWLREQAARGDGFGG